MLRRERPEATLGVAVPRRERLEVTLIQLGIF
jgi:hypothetical protein